MTVNDRSVLLNRSQGDSGSVAKSFKQSQGNALSGFGNFLSQKQAMPQNRPDAFLSANRQASGSVNKELRFQNQVKERHTITREQDQSKVNKPSESKKTSESVRSENEPKTSVKDGKCEKRAKEEKLNEEVKEEKLKDEVNYEEIYQDTSNQVLIEPSVEKLVNDENTPEGELIQSQEENSSELNQQLEMGLTSEHLGRDANGLNQNPLTSSVTDEDIIDKNDIKPKPGESELVEKNLKTTEDILRTLLASENLAVEKEVKKEFSDLIQDKDLLLSQDHSEKKVQANVESTLTQDFETQDDSKDFMQSMQQMILKQPTGVLQDKPLVNSFQNQIYSQISQSIKSNLNLTEKGSSMLLKLKPESLGEVELKLSIQRGVVLAEIKVENEMVRAAVEANLEDLKQNLTNKGYDNPSIQVNVQSDGFNEDSLFNSKDQSHLSQSNKSKKGQINLDLDAEFEDMVGESDDNAGDLKINYLG